MIGLLFAAALFSMPATGVYCEHNVRDPWCADARNGPKIELTEKREALMRRLVATAYAKPAPDLDANGKANDLWQALLPGDCEDAALWMTKQIRKKDAAMGQAARPLLLVQKSDAIAKGHIVLVIDTDKGVRILDQMWDHPRRPSDYAEWTIYAPKGPLSGVWEQVLLADRTQ